MVYCVHMTKASRRKSIVLSSSLFLVAIVGYVAFFSPKAETPQQSQPQSAETQPATDTPTAVPSTTTAAVPGAYKEYSEQAVADSAGTDLLFFHAPWCPQCRALEASIKDTALPENVTVFKVDYDANQALRKKYGVTIQTTVVKVDSSGNLVKRYVAYQQPNFESLKVNLLQ